MTKIKTVVIPRMKPTLKFAIPKQFWCSGKKRLVLFSYKKSSSH